VNVTPTKRRKVLLIHHSGLIGGAGKSLLDLWRALSPHFDVVAYVPSQPPELLRFLGTQGVPARSFKGRMAKVPYYSGGENLWHPRFWFYVSSIPFQRSKWRRIIADEGADAVIVNSSVLCWMGAILKGRVSICYVRETLRGQSMSVINRVLRRMREKFSGVAYLSEFDRRADRLQNASPIIARDATDPSVYCDTLVKRPACAKLAIPMDSFNVLYVGGVSWLKGIDVAIKAMQILRNERVRLLVAGLPPDPTRPQIWRRSLKRASRFQRKMLREVKVGGIDRRIHYLGVLDEMSPAYSASDAIVFPMNRPHQARPAFEAGFQAKPVVITDYENVSECVVHGVNGLVFGVGDSKALARNIRRLAHDPGLTHRLGQANRVHALAEHDQARSFDALIEFLHCALSKREGGGP